MVLGGITTHTPIRIIGEHFTHYKGGNASHIINKHITAQQSHNPGEVSHQGQRMPGIIITHRMHRSKFTGRQRCPHIHIQRMLTCHHGVGNNSSMPEWTNRGACLIVGRLIVGRIMPGWDRW